MKKLLRVKLSLDMAGVGHAGAPDQPQGTVVDSSRKDLSSLHWAPWVLKWRGLTCEPGLVDLLGVKVSLWGNRSRALALPQQSFRLEG